MAELPLQTPPPGHFSFFELSWTPVSHRPPPTGGDKAEAMTVQQAKIPWDRVRDFITGEEARCSAHMHPKRSRLPAHCAAALLRDGNGRSRDAERAHTTLLRSCGRSASAAFRLPGSKRLLLTVLRLKHLQR